MLILPASLALAFALYLPLPQAAAPIARLLARLYAPVRSAFTDRKGNTDERSAAVVFALLLCGVAAILAALHPALAALTIAPLFTALSHVPRAAAVKRELDSGAYANDIAVYEALVSETSASLAPVFAAEAFLPLLLCALGLALRLGGGLGWAVFGLRAACGEDERVQRFLAPLLRASDRVLFVLMLSCSFLVGRNPFRTRGDGLGARMLSVLGIAKDSTRIHPPMAGDIAQAAFLCCFCLGLLCFTLTLMLFAVL